LKIKKGFTESLSFEIKFWVAPLPCHAQTLAYLADNPETLHAALSGTKTKEEITTEIFAFYEWTLPL